MEFECDPYNDVIQFHYFKRAVPEIISMMQGNEQRTNVDNMDGMLDRQSEENLKGNHEKGVRQ